MTSTTVDALKALYVALGGTAADVADLNVIPDVINAIAGLGAIVGASAISVTANGNTVIKPANGRNLRIETTGDGSLTLLTQDELSLSGNSGVYITATDGDLNLDAPSGEIIATADADVNINTTGNTADVVIQPKGDIKLLAEEGGIDMTSGSSIAAVADEVTINGKNVVVET